jgi:hypothetical protein
MTQITLLYAAYGSVSIAALQQLQSQVRQLVRPASQRNYDAMCRELSEFITPVNENAEAIIKYVRPVAFEYADRQSKSGCAVSFEELVSSVTFGADATAQVNETNKPNAMIKGVGNWEIPAAAH